VESKTVQSRRRTVLIVRICRISHSLKFLDLFKKMAFKNLKPNKSKKNGKFKGNDYDEGFPRMKASVKGKEKEKIVKNKWKDYEPEEDDDE
jgi:hypothetical protein